MGLRALGLGAISAVLGAAGPAGLPPGAPAAREEAVAETYFAKKITDPYRWMEQGGAELASWAQAQDAAARNVLAGLPARAAILAALKEGAAQAVVSDVTRVGGRLFYLRAQGGAAPGLYARDLAGGAERRVLDGARLAGIAAFRPSQDGRYVAVVSQAGTGAGDAICVVDAETGAVLPDRIAGGFFGSISWLPDGSSFFYTRMAEAGGGGTVYWHHLASKQADAAVFGGAAGGAPGLAAGQNVALFAIAGTRDVLGISRDPGSPEISVYAGTLPAGRQIEFGWRKVAGAEDGVLDAAAANGKLYLRREGKQGGEIAALDLEGTDNIAQAKRVLAAGDGVLSGLAAGRDGIYLVSRQGLGAKLLRVDGAGKSTEVKLPSQGLLSDSISADPRVPGVVVGLQAWVSAPLWFSAGTADGADVTALPLGGAATAAPDVVVTETQVAANDGRTRLPLSIIEPRGVAHDKHRPVLVYAYGAYGVAVTPNVALARIIRAWVGAGGVMAIAHVRGGGEGGEAWHAAGARAGKALAAHDLVDCAWSMGGRFDYGNPASIAVMGEGAGAVVAGGAITSFPTQIQAALLIDGLNDPLRAQLTGDGAAAEAEFGSVHSAADFAALLGADAYQHVHVGVPYPAVMAISGGSVWHEPLWESAKMVARLQAAGRGKGPVLLRVGAGRADADNLLADGLAFLMAQLGGK